MKNKEMIKIIPSTIEFTTELDNTNNTGNPYAEHNAVVAISTDADISTPFGIYPHGILPNGLFFETGLEGGGIRDDVVYLKDGAGERVNPPTLYPFDINPETRWKIIFQTKNDIKIYRDDALFYENNSFNFPNDYAYIYMYMYSSATQGRYVLFDYIRVTPLKGKNH